MVLLAKSNLRTSAISLRLHSRPCLTADDSTVALYTCDSAGDSNLIDLSGNGLDGTIYGAKYIEMVPSAIDEAVRESREAFDRWWNHIAKARRHRPWNNNPLQSRGDFRIIRQPLDADAPPKIWTIDVDGTIDVAEDGETLPSQPLVFGGIAAHLAKPGTNQRLVVVRPITGDIAIV